MFIADIPPPKMCRVSKIGNVIIKTKSIKSKLEVSHPLIMENNQGSSTNHTLT
jgi:hypothetical protein